MSVLLAGCSTAPAHHANTPTTGATPSATSSPAGAPAQLPGSDWHLHNNGSALIQGYAGEVAIDPGQQLHLYVSTTAARFRVDVVRMGWYRGTLGRIVATTPWYPGRAQPAPVVLRARNTVEARWTLSATLSTDGWRPGDYLLRLDPSAGHESYIPLTVRAASAAGTVVLVSPVTTWQAYNTWGCCDLYDGDGGFASRSRAVSFDRPYAQSSGAGEFIKRELPVLAEAERLGLSLDYVTDIDLQTPGLLTGARAVVSMGHDEYWSPQMRAAVEAARDAGTNLAFFGANAVFRRIRFEASPLGADRIVIDYKVAREDPLYGVDNAEVTADWPAPPDANPESTLLGAMYNCFVHGPRAAGVVVDASSWLLAGIPGVRDGLALPGLIGPEVDSVQLGYPTPRPIEVVLHSPFQCPGGRASHADTTYYTAASGAAVFDAGSIDWACAVATGCSATPLTGRVVRAVTDRLLVAFAAGPAGRAHPARDNLRSLGLGG